jgi:hypothetical protein
MDKILFSLLLMLLLCPLAAVYHRIGGYATDYSSETSLAVEGNLALIADLYDLLVLDVSDPSDPILVGDLYTGRQAIFILISGNLAYVGEDYYGLRIVDLSVPSAPATLGYYNAYGSDPGYLALNGNHIYLCLDDELLIIDVSDPADPQLASTFAVDNFLYGVAIENGIAYLANGEYGLVVVNVSDPGSPTLISACDTPGWAAGVECDSGFLYLADWTGGIRIYNVANPASPQLLGTYDTRGNAYRMKLQGDTLWVADDEGGLLSIDVSDPANPYPISCYDTPGRLRALALANDIVYVADSETGLQVIDVSEPQNPTLVYSYDTQSSARSICLQGDFAYIVDGAGLQIFDVSQHAPAQVSFLNYYSGASCVSVAGNLACLSHWGTLKLIDVSDPTAPVQIGSLALAADGIAWLQIDGNHVYVLLQYHGLKVVNISNPYAPYVEGSYDMDNPCRSFAKAGSYLYAALDYYGFRVFDVSNPGLPTNIGFLNLPPSVRALALYGIHAYVANDRAGLTVVDVSNPSQPLVLNTIPPLPGGIVSNVIVNGGRLYAVDEGWNQIGVYDLSDPSSPLPVTSYAWNLNTLNLAVSGSLVYTVNDLYGFNISGLADVEDSEQDFAPPPDPSLCASPNPFRGETSISWKQATPASAKLEIFNCRGQLVRRLEAHAYPAGGNTAVWDGMDAAGRRVAPGLYLCRLHADGRSRTLKLLLTR